MNLTPPPPDYRVESEERLGWRYFETVEKAREEDQKRVDALRSADLVGAERQDRQRLADRLQDALDTGTPDATLASAVFTREVRRRVTGAVWQLHDRLGFSQGRRFDLLPRKLSVTEGEFLALNPRKLMRRMRADLYRAGAGRASGCVVLFLHGEWNHTTQRWQLHFHGWATGEMVEVVRQLRKQRKYKSTKAASVKDPDGVHQRVRIGRKPLANPAYQLSYLLTFWPARSTGKWAPSAGGQLVTRRQRKKHRVPNPHQARILFWLDRWTADDLSLRIGVSVKAGRLQLSGGLDSYSNGEG